VEVDEPAQEGPREDGLAAMAELATLVGVDLSPAEGCHPILHGVLPHGHDAKRNLSVHHPLGHPFLRHNHLCPTP
jgi:hypothetical protein